MPGETFHVLAEGLGPEGSIATVELRAPGRKDQVGALATPPGDPRHNGFGTVPLDFPTGQRQVSVFGETCNAGALYRILDPSTTTTS